jgi:hypothetical protein
MFAHGVSMGNGLTWDVCEVNGLLLDCRMADKLHEMGASQSGGRVYAFHCPGCEYGHCFDVPRWFWNGSFEKPTFQPSLLCNQHDVASRCHLFVTDGGIQFLSDCWHALAGQTVELPDWDLEPVQTSAQTSAENEMSSRRENSRESP